ncbi:MAG: anaerobic sulfatase maturase [Lentisphaerae bacterium]|nr:anaerobic sulfatase maturase [Lentisphaerota bacterium]
MNKPFSLLIKPAGPDCNLECAYCFYRSRGALFPETPMHRMSMDILEKVIASYMATDQPVYAFAWQGGEPLLMGLDFFQSVIQLQKRFGRNGAVAQNSLQTNGLLITDELAKHFFQYRFLLGVSLDGPESIHNIYRVNAAGAGSFAAVWRGIECLRRQGVDFNILTLVTQANVRQGSAVYGYLRDQGLHFHQYIPCVEADERGALANFSIMGEAWGEFLCAVYDEWIKDDTRRVSVRLFDSILNLLVDGRKVDCTMRAACDTYVVVEHNGAIYPCDFHVDSKWRLGNIRETSWEQVFTQSVYRQFIHQKSEWNETCSVCQWRRLCAGDCLKHRANPAGSPRALSRLCAGWKLFFAHTHRGFEQLADQIRQERAQPGIAAAKPTSNKPGRNDYCPCGSGLKYKKCCLRVPAAV